MDTRMRIVLRWLTVALGVLGVVSAPALGQDAPLSVMTFNVRLPIASDGPNAWENRRDLLVRTIAEARPDIIGTQELHKPQGDYIIDRLPDYAWFGIDRRGGHDDEHMGVFYRRDRLTLIDLGNYWLSDTPETPGSISWGHPYPRMVTWGLFEIKADGRRFYFYNTHFPYRAEDDAARLKAAELILTRIAMLPADVPLVMAGDFNTPPGGPVHALLTETLTDARLAAPTNEGPDATFHTFTGKADRRIDWILSRGLQPRSTRTLTDSRGGRYPSDHFPVVAELVWPTPSAASGTFTNPLLPSGSDPWVTRHGETYYYMHTLGNRLAIWKTRDIADLANAKEHIIWTPPADGPNAISIWAPELHRIDGKWYVYYTAAASGHDGDAHRGIFVLENASDDPLSGEWIDRGRVNTGRSGIDGTTFEHGGKRYFVYSPYVGPDSVLAIARMTNPWTLAGEEAIIARPDLGWERKGGRQILEGPEFLPGPNGDLFLTYSASACWSDDYALGLLRAPAGSDPLDPDAWTKSPQPVLAKAPENGAYATGHNGFFTSPDGRENWIIYHANSGPDMKCTAKRSPYIQPFRFGADGAPMFGKPVGSAARLEKPSNR